MEIVDERCRILIAAGIVVGILSFCNVRVALPSLLCFAPQGMCRTAEGRRFVQLIRYDKYDRQSPPSPPLLSLSRAGVEGRVVVAGHEGRDATKEMRETSAGKKFRCEIEHACTPGTGVSMSLCDARSTKRSTCL